MMRSSTTNFALVLLLAEVVPVSRNPPVSAFMMFALWTIVTFLRPVRDRVLERVLERCGGSPAAC